MSPEAIRARLAALREAGTELRRRPAREVVDALAEVLERWRDPKSDERLALERELPAASGFAAATVARGLQLALEAWSGDALRALAERELARNDGTLARGADTSAVLLAGAIPMPTLLGIVAPLALRSPVLAKTASRDARTAHRVAASIAEVDPGLGACIEVVDFAGSDGACTDALLEAECVIATGSDETIAAVEARIAPTRTLLRHGHGLSIGVLGPDATRGDALERAARGLALDTALWDQQGCLSPIAVYVMGGVEDAARVGAALASELEAIARELPRGEVDAHAAATARAERSEAEVRAAAGGAVTLLGGADAGWSVVVEADAAVRPAPLFRFLRVHPLEAGALEAALAPLSGWLAGAAVAGFGADSPAALLGGLGAHWICEPGQLQCPPLDWPRDGRPVLAGLSVT